MQKRHFAKAAPGSSSMQPSYFNANAYTLPTGTGSELRTHPVSLSLSLATPIPAQENLRRKDKRKIQHVLINNYAPDWRRNDSSSLSPTWGALPVRSSSSLHSNRFWSGCRRARLNQMYPPARYSDISLSRPSWPASYTWPDDSARLLRSERRAYRQLRGTSSAGSGNGFRRG